MDISSVFLPANVAQAFAQGLYSLVEEKQGFSRTLYFNLGDAFFPLDKVSTGLGFDFTATYLWTRTESDGPDIFDRQLAAALQILCRAKTSSLRGFCNQSPR